MLYLMRNFLVILLVLVPTLTTSACTDDAAPVVRDATVDAVDASDASDAEEVHDVNSLDAGVDQ
jgi:hypothetical protein